MTKPLEPQFWIDLSDELKDMSCISLALDYAERVFILITPSNYKTKASGIILPPYSFRILEATEHYSVKYEIGYQDTFFSYAHPLPNDELLLASSRSRYYGNEKYELNGSIFNQNGTLNCRVLLGGGIEQLQTTADGSIWTGHYLARVDGPLNSTQPVGVRGLIRWDSQGILHSPYSNSSPVFCNYALNAISGKQAWHYYYTSFHLAQIVDDKVSDYWVSPVKYSHSFAIWNEYVLFFRDDLFHLYRLGKNHEMTEVAIYEYDDIENIDYVFARRNIMVLVKNDIFYKIDIADLV